MSLMSFRSTHCPQLVNVIRAGLQVNVWLDHQKAANGGQPVGTPQSSVAAASTPVQQSAAAAAGTAAGLAVAQYAAAASGTAADRSVSATLSPDDAQQTGSPPADSVTPESQGAAGVTHETKGTAAGQQQGVGAETAGGVVRSAVRALEFGGESVAVAQPDTLAAGSSPLTGSPESPVALVAEAGEATGAAEYPAAADPQVPSQLNVPSESATGAPASVVVEPARSLPPDARLADAMPAEDSREADGNAADADSFAGMADSAAELRALLTTQRAEMRAGSEQLRAQFETGQARRHARVTMHCLAMFVAVSPCRRHLRRQLS